MAEIQLCRKNRGTGKHPLETTAGQGVWWGWPCMASGGLWGRSVAPVSSSLITCQPNWPGASRSVPCDLLLVLNVQLIKSEGEMKWPESCLVWLSSPLFSLTTTKNSGCVFYPEPPNSLLGPCCYFLFFSPFQKLSCL